MKVALHFEQASHGLNASQLVLSSARAAKLLIRSRVYAGTLLIHTGAAVQRRTDNAVVETTDPEAYAALITEWLTPQPFNWFALHPRASEIVRADKIFCVQFDTIEPAIALRLHDELRQGVGAAYLGALQVDESFRSHLAGYQLPAFARVDGERAFASWDGISEDSKMPFVVEMLRRCGFDPVAYESLAAKFTVFDRHAGAAASQRRARCRASIIGLFDSVVDATLGRLEDALPELHERVWTILNTYEGAEVAEQYSQVALSCRRLIEYAADCLFPPTETTCGARKLDQPAFKNRLLKYLQDRQISKADQNLIEANVDAAASELDRLIELVNKGVHASSGREQARRCILRTTLLLDDLCAVSRDGLDVQIALDTDFVRQIVGRRLDEHTS